MTTTQRERYQQALTELEQAHQEITREEMMQQVAMNRLREAEVEGFDESADEIEQRADSLAARLDTARQALMSLTQRAEELRVLAVTEEIDEIVVGFDQALLSLLADVERLESAITGAAATAQRVTSLAENLPAAAIRPHRTAEAAVRQVHGLEEAAAQFRTALTQVALPAAATEDGQQPPV